MWNTIEISAKNITIETVKITAFVNNPEMELKNKPPGPIIQQFSLMDSLIFPILILLVLYFFMIRPQMNQAKKEKKFSSDINRGDRVVTKSGIYGTINDINHKEGTCIIATMAGKIKFDKSAISMDLTNKLKKLNNQ